MNMSVSIYEPSEAMDSIRARSLLGGGGRKSTSELDIEGVKGIRGGGKGWSTKTIKSSSIGKKGRKSVSDLESNLDCAAAFLQVKVMAADMPESMQVHAFRCARRSWDGLERFSTRQIAHDIKKEFDKAYGAVWHCIVGTNFGSFVTHSTGCFLYFSMEKLIIMLFRTRDPRDLLSN